MLQYTGISDLIHYLGSANSAAAIAASIEAAVVDGRLTPSSRLPAVRDLASQLAVSPATVAAAYRTLGQRGAVNSGPRGTVVATQPALRVRGARPVPPGTRDLTSGNPDRRLLPSLAPALAALSTEHKLYGGPSNLASLVELAAADFAADGIAGDTAIAGGALDAIERVLTSWLRPGDLVVLEDPCWPRITDLVRALGLRVAPTPVDEYGIEPGPLEQALQRGARALIATPRGQNPTGAALDRERAAQLRDLLAGHPALVVVEDDYVAPVSGVPYFGLHRTTERWVVVRSLSKVLGPDLRIAPLNGDSLTVGRVEGRQLLGTGWVSHLLQQMAAELWSGASADLLPLAERTYSERRTALVDALREHGISAQGQSGLGVWVPLTDEVATVQGLLDRGYAVSAGERYRHRSAPGIRITTTTLGVDEAGALAAAVYEAIHAPTATYTG